MLTTCACSFLFTHICCRHRCLQTHPMCLQPFIYVHLLQAPVPANSPHVPAAHYLRTFAAGIDACKLSPCACTISFTHICCRHACLQTQPACLQPTIYAHLLQASMLANSAPVPAPYYLRTSAAGTHACKPKTCACAMLFTHIRCRHASLQTEAVCLANLSDASLMASTTVCVQRLPGLPSFAPINTELIFIMPALVIAEHESEPTVACVCVCVFNHSGKHRTKTLNFQYPVFSINFSLQLHGLRTALPLVTEYFPICPGRL